MVEQLIGWDRSFTVWINSFHAPFWDDFFFRYTHMWVWAPFYIAYLYFIYKNNGKKNFWWILAIGLTILLTDQISSGILKPLTERWRPSRDPELQGVIHTVNGYIGGKYGFTSSHASNTFGVATLLMLYFKDKWQYLLLILWAVLTGYSRIYLGVHFFGDVICGTLIGILCGSLVYRLFRHKLTPMTDTSLLDKTTYSVFLLSIIIFSVL